jgi:hypothetical protein
MMGRMLLLCFGLCEETLLESSRSLPVEGSDFPVQEKKIDNFLRGGFVSFIGAFVSFYFWGLYFAFAFVFVFPFLYPILICCLNSFLIR